MSARCVECQIESIERCEVTGVPLCADHLWYAEDGRRISERVAKQLSASGVKVIEPQHYIEQLGHVMALPRLPLSPPPLISQQRNGSDIVALLAGICGVVSLATCFGIGIALCIPPLPLLPLILGGVGLAGSKYATRPQQARVMSWIGIVGGAGFVILVLLALLASAMFGTASLLPTFYVPQVTPTVQAP
jgi:thiol:disulfide interchange protein